MTDQPKENNEKLEDLDVAAAESDAVKGGSLNFTSQQQPGADGLLLPAVQKVREAAARIK